MCKGPIIIISFFLLLSGCGVKGKPLPPLQQPFISTGDYKEDQRKKQNEKKKSTLSSPATNQENTNNEKQ